MNDLSNSVIVPVDHLNELNTAAYDNSHVPSASERIGQTLQTTAIFGAMAGAVGAGTWMYVRAHDWLETRRLRRTHAPEQFLDSK